MLKSRWLVIGIMLVLVLAIGAVWVMILTKEAPVVVSLTPTATLTISQDKATFYRLSDVRELAKNPDEFYDQRMIIEGEVFFIDEGNELTAMQVWVNKPDGNRFDREAIVVTTTADTDRIYEGTVVKVWGIGIGTFEGTNAFGGAVKQPIVAARYLEYHN